MYFELSFGVEEQLLANFPESSQTPDDFAYVLPNLSHQTVHLLAQLANLRIELLAVWQLLVALDLPLYQADVRHRVQVLAHATNYIRLLVKRLNFLFVLFLELVDLGCHRFPQLLEQLHPKRQTFW